MKFFAKTFATFCLITSFLGVNMVAFGAESKPKLAVVDIGIVVSKSSQVEALKLEQQSKLKELESWLVTAKSDVEKQSTKENKEKLTKKYDEEFIKKQKVIKENYTKKLQVIDKNITSIIVKEAKNKGYDMVFSKSIVLYGGVDITQDIAKLVK